MTSSPTTPIREFLRSARAERLTEEVRAEKLAAGGGKSCARCGLCAAGVREIPKPSAPQCDAHLALNRDYGRAIARFPAGKLHELREDTVRRGFETWSEVRDAA